MKLASPFERDRQCRNRIKQQKPNLKRNAGHKSSRWLWPNRLAMWPTCLSGLAGLWLLRVMALSRVSRPGWAILGCRVPNDRPSRLKSADCRAIGICKWLLPPSGTVAKQHLSNRKTGAGTDDWQGSTRRHAGARYSARQFPDCPRGGCARRRRT